MNGCACLKVEQFTGAVGLKEGRKRLGERIKFLSKGLYDLGVVTLHPEFQFISNKMEPLGWRISGSPPPLQV